MLSKVALVIFFMKHGFNLVTERKEIVSIYINGTTIV